MMSDKTEETMFRIYFKGESESPYPDEQWLSKDDAERAVTDYEAMSPEWKGKLEVRESGQKIEGI